MPSKELLSKQTKASNGYISGEFRWAADDGARSGGMKQGVGGKQSWPALLLAVLALFSCVSFAAGQTIRDLPPPPPAPKPKPKPTPPPKDEDFDVIKTNSNLVMVPVSVVDAQGQAVHGLQ